MSDRYDNDHAEDEPVIGGSYAPAAPPLSPPAAPSIASGIGYDSEPQASYAANGYDEGFDEDDEYYEDEDEYDEYYDDGGTPARQPMFYVFIAMAALVGGIVVFLLFSLVNNGGGDDAGGGGSTKFNVNIDSPQKDKRIEVGKSEDVSIQATATDPISRFELFVGDKLTDSVDVTETPADNKYRAILHLTLQTKGNYDIFVRVTSSNGATKDSSKVRVIGIEPVGERPQTIKGKVATDTTLRTGPGDNFAESGTLKGGQVVTILGKSRTVDWLLVDTAQGQRWAKRTAIDPLDSLDLVPIRDVTPTPAPTQPPTNTAVPSPSASPSASVSPSPNPNSPDFVPTNAVLIDGGTTLRVTVQNVSNTAYNGPLVVSVGGDVAANSIVVDAKLAANGGSATVDFQVTPPITASGKKAQVTVDPNNAVKELREDNNAATFVLPLPEEAPDIQIQAPQVAPSAITITIQNVGGPLAATNVTLRVKVGNAEAAQSQNIALAKSQTATFTVNKPGVGAATAEVVINGVVVASASFTITS
ncbi:MAG: CARDB domain-containing protein [Dehalococcoidia bacterium]